MNFVLKMMDFAFIMMNFGRICGRLIVVPTLSMEASAGCDAKK